MKRLIKTVAVTAVALAFFSVSQVAYAACAVNNQSYPEGSSVGGYVCKNGQWERTS